jgi:succinoglycan biosynthesis protein ExoA
MASLRSATPGAIEVILAIGPSTDQTLAIAASLADQDARVRIVDNPTGQTAAGLNLAIAASRFGIIVRSDGHAHLGDGYIERAVTTVLRTGAANVGGRMDAQGHTPFQQAVAWAYNSPFGLGGSTFHLASTAEGPAQTVYLGVFRRDALEAVGGFDETLVRAQDWELNLRLRTAGYTVWFDPQLVVVYHPRSTFRALARQFYATGQWRRHLIVRERRLGGLRYVAPPAAVTGIAGGVLAAAIGCARGPRSAAAGAAVPLGYLGLLTWVTGRARDLPLSARARLPAALATMHLSWGLGFLRGPTTRPRSVRRRAGHPPRP